MFVITIRQLLSAMIVPCIPEFLLQIISRIIENTNPELPRSIDERALIQTRHSRCMSHAKMPVLVEMSGQ